MKEKLTDVRLRKMAAAPAGKRITVWDTEVGNFGVRVTDRVDPVTKEPGRTFVVMRRLAGKLVRHKIGTYPAMTLAAAREAARGVNANLERGIDPKSQRKIEAEAAASRAMAETERKSRTFEAAAEAFIKAYVETKIEAATKKRTRYSREMEATIRREMITRWGPMPMEAVTDGLVVDMLSELSASGRYAAARKADAHVRKLFAWTAARRTLGIRVSPLIGLDSKDILRPKVRRKRVLGDEDIKTLWALVSAPLLSYPLGAFVRFLLITGQRLREVADARWCEIDLEQALWTIPPERMKADHAHEVPLSPLALRALAELPRFAASKRECAGHFIFTTTSGLRPISGFSKFKERLSAEMADTAPWVFHDLRRTMRTRLSGLPIAHNVAEMLIAHAQSELDQIYDQHRYLAEKRDAMRLWGDKLSSIVMPARIEKGQAFA